MTVGASVQSAEAQKPCPDCGEPIDAARRYCDRDRNRRRALTYLRLAWRILSPVDELIPFPTARRLVADAMEELDA